MKRARTTPSAVTYNLRNRRQFAINSLLIGGFLGGGTAVAIGGPLAQQTLQAAVLTAAVAGVCYWLLCALAASVTDETGTPTFDEQTDSTVEPTTATASK